MKKLKVSLSAMALLLGIGAALATTPHRNLEDKRWGLNRTTGMYEDITGQTPGTDYECQSASGICSETYPADVNPNDQENDAHPGVVAASSTQQGQFLN